MGLSIKKKNRGFTLIELLVVIAIIGILASVVLASLNSARTKANEAAIIAQVEEVQKQAALYDLSHGAFGTVNRGDDDDAACSGGSTMNDTMFGANALDSSVITLTQAAAEIAPSRSFCVVRIATRSYAYAAHLEGIASNASGRAWCVDSSGNSKEITLINAASPAALISSDGVARCP